MSQADKIADLVSRLYDRAEAMLFAEHGRQPYRDEVGLRVANAMIFMLAVAIFDSDEDRIAWLEDCEKMLNNGLPTGIVS